MGWGEFIVAFGVFFLSHSVPVRPSVRAHLVDRLGQRGFTLAYSVLSLAVLGWVIAAAGRAPFVPVWGWATWQPHVTLTLMLAVCLILGLAIGRPNPFSFGGARNHLFDPERPGLVRITRHPMLLALALWAFGHMIPNGDLAHVILFGSFAGFAVLGRVLIDRRKRREMGAEWLRLDKAVRAQGPSPARPLVAVLRLTLGVALFMLLLGAHPYVFGVAPLG
ncbi:NnrU family protein [uncultured Roseovarius sp.]|uniref:NnrU family protein n=1 Tax=uncultured Roseovarius sp. TaxID=293344 RepID=UPI00262CAD12|nr:NnrU family protein [uncultured Roseovarius sp.]